MLGLDISKQKKTRVDILTLWKSVIHLCGIRILFYIFLKAI